jgi:hypothetical protein
MTIGFSTALRNARLQQIINHLDAGSGVAGAIEFYGAARPATGVAIAAQVLVGTVTLSKPSGTIANGVLTFDTISDDLAADASETISWCRFYDTDGNFVADMSCGTSGSGAEVIFNTVNAIAGGTISITSGALTEGNP